jgi:hypothetical protein
MVQLWCAVFVNHLIHNHCVVYPSIMLDSIDKTRVKADYRCFFVETRVQVRELLGILDTVSHLILEFFISSFQFFIYYKNMIVFLIRWFSIAIGGSFFFCFLLRKLRRKFSLILNITTDANFVYNLSCYCSKCTEKVLYYGNCMLW